MPAVLHSYSLTTLADVKETLGITDNSKDNLLTRLINKATDSIERYCNGRRFISTTHTHEEFDGDGTSIYNAKNYPITDIVDIEYLTSDPDTDEWDAVDESLYSFDMNSGIVRNVSRFHTGFMNWRISYTAGYAVIPSDLAEACVDLACYMYNNLNSSGVKSERLGDRSIEWFAVSNSSVIKELGLDEVLDSYRVPVL